MSNSRVHLSTRLSGYILLYLEITSVLGRLLLVVRKYIKFVRGRITSDTGNQYVVLTLSHGVPALTAISEYIYSNIRFG